jgi:protein ImuA
MRRSVPSASGLQREVKDQLVAAIRRIEGATAKRPERDCFPFGLPALDRLLPPAARRTGILVEWLSEDAGSGAATLAMQGVRKHLDQHSGAWAVIDCGGDLNPVAAAGWGIDPQRLLVIRPSGPTEVWWSTEQCLRCAGVAVTWCWARELPERVVQRWKRAVEEGGGVGMLFRPASVRRQPSWADVRWLVRALPNADFQGRRIRVELLSCRGGFGGAAIDLEIDHAAGAVRVVPELASATSAARPARA